MHPPLQGEEGARVVQPKEVDDGDPGHCEEVLVPRRYLYPGVSHLWSALYTVSTALLGVNPFLESPCLEVRKMPAASVSLFEEVLVPCCRK